MTHVEKMRLQAALKALQGTAVGSFLVVQHHGTLSLLSRAEDEQADTE